MGENTSKRMHKTEVRSGISYKGSIKLQYRKKGHISVFTYAKKWTYSII